jgi:hypothetical protein
MVFTGNVTGNLTGNVTGNTSGTAATVTSGTQAAITTCANLTTVGTVTTGTWSGVIDGSATMTLGSDATGDIYYRDASGFLERLAAGADGYVLTGTGAGSIPAWEAVAAGVSLSGSTNNTIATVTGADALIGEANLTFDGSTLAVTGTASTSGNMGVGNADLGSTYFAGQHLLVGDEDASTGDTTAAVVVATKVAGTGGIYFTDNPTTAQQGFVRYDHTNDHLELGANTYEQMSIQGGGWVGIGSTANAFMTTGLTIDQATADNDILAFKSTGDVVHGMTSVAEPNTYGLVMKISGTAGGLMLRGLGSAANALAMQAHQTTNNTAKSTIGYGAFDVDTYKKTSGTTSGAMDANANLMTIRSSGTTRFIFDAEGSGHADVEWTTYSDSRLKKNVIDCPYGLAEVLQLEPKTFDKHSGKIEDGEVVLEEKSLRMIGFLAQDVKALMPELVKDLPDDQSFYSLNDGKLAAVLVNAIQELNAKLEAD